MKSVAHGFAIFFALYASALGQYNQAVYNYVTGEAGSNVDCSKPPGQGQCWDLAACAVTAAGVGPTWDCSYSAAYGGLAPLGWTPETDQALRLEHRQKYSGVDYNKTGSGFGGQNIGSSPTRRQELPMKVPSNAKPELLDDYTAHPNCYVFGTPLRSYGTTGTWADIWNDASATFTGSGVQPGDVLQLDNFQAQCSNGASVNTAGAMHTAVISGVLANDLTVCQQHWGGSWIDTCGFQFFSSITNCPGSWTYSYDALIIYRPEPNGAGGAPCTHCPASVAFEGDNSNRYDFSRVLLAFGSMSGLGAVLALSLLLRNRLVSQTSQVMAPLLE